MAEIATRLANEGDLEAIAELFDGYRQFYGQQPDLRAARAFIAERLTAQDSVILIAYDAGKIVGFAQLYASFTSVGMGRIFILNDLFVAPDRRGTGTGRALLDAAAQYGREAGAVRVELTTQTTNTRAMRVYEANGWIRDHEFYTYNLKLAG